MDGEDRTKAVDHLSQAWPNAVLDEDQSAVRSIGQRIFASDGRDASRPFHLQLKGTNFQVNVWRALLAIPKGKMLAYGDIAAFLGRPKASRAVAGAIAVNPVAYLIPCHRVIARSGMIHGYRWGAVRKKAMLGWEAARPGLHEPPPTAGS